MAFRIQKAIVRGEITNEVPGVVTGRLWIAGRPDPLVLQLEGNCLRDLAGCSLTIHNPSPEPEGLDGLDTEQFGAAGVMTASRKTRIPTVSEEELLELLGAGQPVPCRYTNFLYLEWFSQSNGRVVIESDACQLTISEPRWILPDPNDSAPANPTEEPGEFLSLPFPAEGEASDDDADPDVDSLDFTAFGDGPGFDDEDEDDLDDFERLLEPGLGDPASEFDPFDEEADEADDDTPLDEFDWELELREAERRAESPGHSDAATGSGTGPGSGAAHDQSPAAPDAGAPAEREAPPPAQTRIAHHHLSGRALDLATALHRAVRSEGRHAPSATEKPLRAEEQAVAAAFLFASQLANALDGIALGFEPEPGFVVAMLKRSLVPLNEALRGCSAVLGAGSADAPPPSAFISTRDDLFALRSEILDLMNDLRSGI